MKTRSSIASALLVALLTAPSFSFAAPRPTPAPSPSVAPKLDVAVAATVIQHAVAKYQTKSTPKLDSVDLTFKVTSGNAKGIGFSFWIITFGFTESEIDTRTVGFSYKLKPTTGASPTPSPAMSPGATASAPPKFNSEVLDFNILGNLDIEALAEKDVNFLAQSVASQTKRPAPDMKKFEEGLSSVIDAAAKAAAETPKIGGADFQTFSVTIEYTVKIEGTGAASIPVFQVLTIGPKGSVSRDTSHSIKLTFTK